MENRAGASQMIGAERVVRSPADGHTVLFITATFVTTAAVRRDLPFDPVSDLAPVGLVATSPLVMTVHPSLPVRKVSELIALARARPGQILYATSGSGSILHLGIEQFAAAAQLRLEHVPYKSGVPAVTNTISGEVQLTANSLSLLMPHVRSNRLRALAVTTLKRTGLAPEIPTIHESGLPGYDVQLWYALLAPGRTPREVIARLNGEIQRFLTLDVVKSRLAAEGAEAAPTSPEALGRMVRAELEKWRALATKLNIRLEAAPAAGA
ncbi:MAG: tripartite tricarboxylate transporter substrate binding protein [Gammaproteobacteria bacterium]|nr:tripartite tricarboxylate transporter substrate binding protein [Gammaproteobacteria bacterium]